MDKRSWQFRVVKRMRGMQHQWFDFPTAETFLTEQSAREYASKFAANQRAAGVTPFKIDVRSRRGDHTLHTERG